MCAVIDFSIFWQSLKLNFKFAYSNWFFILFFELFYYTLHVLILSGFVTVSAPKKNWSDWIWFESDLSNQIRSNISDLQFTFSSKKFWTDQISSDQSESDQNQISSNSIQSKLIWSDSSGSNFKIKNLKMRFIDYFSIQ